MDNQKNSPCLIAVDGGGTKTRFLLLNSEGGIEKSCLSGSTNPNIVGFDACLSVLTEGLDRLLPNRSVTGFASLGIAGILRNNIGMKLEKELSLLFPHIRFHCRADVWNLLDGCTEDPFAVAGIIGTGSSVFVKSKDNVRAFGGWGYVLDAKGNGYSIGLDVLRAVLADIEGIGRHTSLTPLVSKIAGNDEQSLISFAYPPEPGKIASLAPFAFKASESGDEVAYELISENAAAAAALCEKVMDMYPRTGTIFLSGGIAAGQPLFFDMVRSMIKRPVEVSLFKGPQILGACIDVLRMSGRLLPEDRARLISVLSKDETIR